MIIVLLFCYFDGFCSFLMKFDLIYMKNIIKENIYSSVNNNMNEHRKIY